MWAQRKHVDAFKHSTVFLHLNPPHPCCQRERAHRHLSWTGIVPGKLVNTCWLTALKHWWNCETSLIYCVSENQTRSCSISTVLSDGSVSEGDKRIKTVSFMLFSTSGSSLPHELNLMLWRDDRKVHKMKNMNNYANGGRAVQMESVFTISLQPCTEYLQYLQIHPNSSRAAFADVWPREMYCLNAEALSPCVAKGGALEDLLHCGLFKESDFLWLSAKYSFSIWFFLMMNASSVWGSAAARWSCPHVHKHTLRLSAVWNKYSITHTAIRGRSKRIPNERRVCAEEDDESEGCRRPPPHKHPDIHSAALH